MCVLNFSRTSVLWFKVPLSQWHQGALLPERKKKADRAEARSIHTGGEVAGHDAEAVVFHLLQKSDTKSLIFPTHPTTLYSQMAGVQNAPFRSETGSLKPGALPPTSSQQPPPLTPAVSLSLSPSLPFSFMSLWSSCCPENRGSGIHIWAH